MSYDRSQFVTAPWGGWDQSAPSLLLAANSFRQVTGWLINKMRLQPFPSLLAFTGPPDGEAIQGAATFTDVVGFNHTGVMTKDHVYYLNGSGYSLQGTIPTTSSEAFQTLVFLNRLFYANGVGKLSYLDGGAGINIAGDTPGSCFFLGKIASSLVQLNLQEGAISSPLDIRYSGINNPLEWDATVDVTAGRLTIPEVEDQISGWANQRGQGVIFRNKGISILSPTGSILPRFSVSSFEDGPNGVGVNFVYTLASYGDKSIFGAEDDFYLMDSLSAPQPIGGKAKKQIFQDLAGASADPWSCFLGRLTNGLDYLAYWLNIPQSNNSFTSTWVFHFDDKTWVNEQLPFGASRWMGNVAVQ